jgi:hypothetical protein
MNIKILEEIERQVTISLGTLSMIDSPEDENSKEMLRQAKAQLIGIVHGIRNVVDHAPMTLGELEDRQFNRAKNISSNRPTVQQMIEETTR